MSKSIGYRLSLLFIFVLTACSGETIKRTTYETLQNMRDMECSKHPSVECEQRETLEVYEDKRREAEK